MSRHLWYSQLVTYVNTQVTGIILLCAKINICSMNKNQKKYFLFPTALAIICANMRVCDFLGITRIRTHNLSLARTLFYHQTTPSHMTNNEIFSFYHHFLISYITCFTAIMISNEKLFNYKVVDLVASYNFRIYFFFHLRLFENFENLKFEI